MSIFNMFNVGFPSQLLFMAFPSPGGSMAGHQDVVASLILAAEAEKLAEYGLRVGPNGSGGREGKALRGK